MPVLNTTHHPENRETTVLLRPKDLHRPSLAGLVVFVAIYFNGSDFIFGAVGLSDKKPGNLCFSHALRRGAIQSFW